MGDAACLSDVEIALSGLIPMARNPYLASILSIVVPGLGQIYAGEGGRGAAILIAVIVVGNLNALWLSVHGLTDPAASAIWARRLPRIIHDVFAVYGIIFWLWQVWDAFTQTKGMSER